MVEYSTTKKSHKITLYSSDNVKVNEVYNRLFFSSFGFRDFRIHKHGDTIEMGENDNDAESISFIDVFGKEQQPNGYITLPLRPEDFQEQDVLDTTKEYVNKYKKTGVQLESSIDVYFPLEIPIYHFDESQENNMHGVGGSNMSYKELSRFFFDLYAQITYLLERGYHFREIRKSSIFVIDGKHILCDGETLEKNNESGNGNGNVMKKICLVFLEFIHEMVGKENIHTLLGTPLHYFIQRMENENILLWIHAV